MWTVPALLAKCEELKRCGMQLPIEAGARVGRGFADLGREEFLVLPSQRLLSLFTGQMSELNDTTREHLFVIPDTDRAIEILRDHGYDISQLEFQNQRTWCLQAVHHQSSEVIRAESATVHGVLLESLLSLSLRQKSAEADNQ